MPKGLRKSKIKSSRGAGYKHVQEAAHKASIGNDWWKLRAKHGRDVLFKSPLKLLEAATEYIAWVESHPLYRSEWKGRGLISIPVKRVATLNGFCLYCDTTPNWWHQFKSSETFAANDGFSLVMTKVESMFYQHKFEGAASGFFNANIIARDLGLRENTDVTTAGQAIAAPVFKVITTENKIAKDEKDIES